MKVKANLEELYYYYPSNKFQAECQETSQYNLVAENKLGYTEREYNQAKQVRKFYDSVGNQQSRV